MYNYIFYETIIIQLLKTTFFVFKSADFDPPIIYFFQQ